MFDSEYEVSVSRSISMNKMKLNHGIYAQLTYIHSILHYLLDR
ncbi:conserved hypothetical protein [Photobacterium leiognathi lrivu.4.1]|uniref:Uncharacterized protein n=1 Tax=Photobacterium leiognathi lrivu.4.1 TaxID=1248232 RepID=A0A0U1P969_PHOLE|nr:hypothetical protein PMSV_3312 [Photobacterium leiognathi subsp. mandapamensis svers.1.1.]GAD31210.1 conserved hypothetical protein [Photobacterium leiognathi lrivu.4.1]